MNYKAWFDEDKAILYVKTYKTINADDVHELMPGIEKLFENRKPRLILGDLSENPSETLTKGARQAFKQYSDTVEYDRIAVIGVNSITRMVVKIAVKIVGQGDRTRFFITEDEALAWLKGEA